MNNVKYFVVTKIDDAPDGMGEYELKSGPYASYAEADSNTDCDDDLIVCSTYPKNKYDAPEYPFQSDVD